MVDAPGIVDTFKTDPITVEEATVCPVKKRRGRPRKSDTLAAIQAPGSNGGVGPMPPPARRARKTKLSPLTPPQVDASLVGQSVHGVLDGSFDAGYILTVRVGNSDTILRGVVFGPGLCVPITRANDIAPNVKFAGSGGGGFAGTTATRLSSPVPVSSTTPSSSQVVAAFADVTNSRHQAASKEVVHFQQQQQQHHQHHPHQQQQQPVFATIVTPTFGVQSSSPAGFADTPATVVQAALHLANGTSQQQQQQLQNPEEALPKGVS